MWRIFWSEIGYRGWDSRLYDFWLRSGARGFGHQYVEENGLAHEWWNFYENFSSPYYYGYAPPLPRKRPVRFTSFDVLFFVSRNVLDKQWYIVGVYGKGVILPEPEISVRVIDLIPPLERARLDRRTKEKAEKDPTFYLLKAPKRVSTILPVPLQADPKEIFGAAFGQAWFKYIDDPSIARNALNLIEEHILSTQDREGLWISRAEAIERIVRLKDSIFG